MAKITTIIDEYKRIKEGTVVRMTVDDKTVRIDLTPEQIEKAIKEFVWYYINFETGKMEDDTLSPHTLEVNS